MKLHQILNNKAQTSTENLRFGDLIEVDWLDASEATGSLTAGKFERIRNPRLRRSLQPDPYLKDTGYMAALENVIATKLANMLRTLCILTQEKTYLVWTSMQQKVF